MGLETISRSRASISVQTNHVHGCTLQPPPLPPFARSSSLFRPPSPDHDEFLVLSLSPVRCNCRLLLLLRPIYLFEPPSLRLVARSIPSLPPQSFSTLLSPSRSHIRPSVAQVICHLSFSQRPPIAHRLNSGTPIPNRTDACRTFRSLISILHVPVYLSPNPSELISGPYQPACICACLARLVDPRTERLEIFIDSGSASCSGTRN